jgi:hypothetical protein
MKRWALLFVALYMLLLIPAFTLTALFAFAPETFDSIPDGMVKMWSTEDPFWPLLWGSIILMGLLQAALLVVPVKVLSRRPVTKKTILWPIVATLVASGGLITTAMMAVHEFLLNVKEMSTGNWVVGFGIVGLIWMIWTFVFGFYAGKKEPANIMGVVAKSLIVGSTLELLIAVPAHVYVRWKHECCAGFYTMWGLATGIAVMLLAFGPAAFVLFVKRCKSIQPLVNQESPPGEQT